jgi:5,10-methylene-tetrahydrofolate dehydrogenase/methenyl tetrahydrofolate cyclohydrolase
MEPSKITRKDIENISKEMFKDFGTREIIIPCTNKAWMELEKYIQEEIRRMNGETNN